VLGKPAGRTPHGVVAGLVADEGTPDLVDAPGLHGCGQPIEGVGALGAQRRVTPADQEQVAGEGPVLEGAGGPDLGDEPVGLGHERQHPHGGEELLVRGRRER
jgi:hypothetical protein